MSKRIIKKDRIGIADLRKINASTEVHGAIDGSTGTNSVQFFRKIDGGDLACSCRREDGDICPARRFKKSSLPKADRLCKHIREALTPAALNYYLSN